MCEGPEVRAEDDTERQAEQGERRRPGRAGRSWTMQSLSGHEGIWRLFGSKESY